MAKELKLVVESKVFENEKNEKIPYFECSVVIGGERFVLKPKAEDKRLFNHFLKQAGL